MSKALTNINNQYTSTTALFFFIKNIFKNIDTPKKRYVKCLISLK